MSKTYKRYTPEEDLFIARLIAEGKTVKEIAAQLNIDARAVENRLKGMRKKEEALSTTHMIVKLVLGRRIFPNL